MRMAAVSAFLSAFVLSLPSASLAQSFEKPAQAVDAVVTALTAGAYEDYFRIVSGGGPVPADVVEKGVAFMEEHAGSGFANPMVLVRKARSENLYSALVSLEGGDRPFYVSVVAQRFSNGSWKVVWSRVNSSIAEFKDML